MKRSDRGAPLDNEPKHEKPPTPAPQTGKNPKDAREDDEQLAENQADLGVGEDHQTDDMEKGHRGTFP